MVPDAAFVQSAQVELLLIEMVTLKGVLVSRL
jgi:hypothetical protein